MAKSKKETSSEVNVEAAEVKEESVSEVSSAPVTAPDPAPAPSGPRPNSFAALLSK